MTSKAAGPALTIRSAGEPRAAGSAGAPRAAVSDAMRQREIAATAASRSRFEPPIVCPACNAPPRATLRLANGAMLLRCPSCLLGWWDWPAFLPEGLYDEAYFQSAEDSKGYDDYASLEPSIRRTARGRLDEIERCRAARARSSVVRHRARPRGRLDAPDAIRRTLGDGPRAERTPTNTCDAPRTDGGVPPYALPPTPPIPTAGGDAHGALARTESGGSAFHDSVRSAGPFRDLPGCEPFILDVGCSTGVFLDEARLRGWRPHGLEVSQYAVQVARRRGLAVRCAAVEGLSLPPAAFDCITMWDVIEHLRDPIGVFAEVSGALKPGGVFALSTGDITSFCARVSGPRWHLFNLPEHLYFYSPRSLQLLLSRAGLRVVAIRREVSWYTADYLAERLAKTLLRRKWSAGPLREWLQSLCVPASLGDIVSVYAAKA